MQYLITGYDGTDAGAEQRRLDAREAHIALGSRLKAEGKMLYAVAILNEQKKMVGSVVVCEFASQEELDAWLKIEPYVTKKVWTKIEIKLCRVGPSFR